MGLFGAKRTRRRIKDDGSLIVLDRVSKSYETGAPALNGVNLRVKRGEFVFIVGDSGSGKSTLIKLLLRELTPTSGTVLVNGQNVAHLKQRQIPKYRRKLGIVFQDFRLLKDRNVYENVAFAQRVIQVPTREIKRNVPAILATVGLAGKYKAKPKQLSGGEQQRVALARALINKPPILLADEPTGNLDPKNSWEIMKLLEKIKAHLEEGKLAKTFDGAEDEDEEAWLASYNLLTYKPVIYAANVAEDDLADDGESNEGVQAVREYAGTEQSEVFVVCAQIEQEIAELDDDEKKMFLEDLGLSESGLEKLIKASYRLLGLISYLTAGEPEVRAWTITKGTKAPQAAGKIHTDFERGFIRAEVVSYDDLIACGSHNAAKEKGLIRLEGKDYVVQDGDIMLFRFNV